MYLDWDVKTNKVNVAGIDRKPATLVRFANEFEFMILKSDGHTSGGYYMPAQFHVWRINQMTILKSGIYFQADELFSFDAKLDKNSPTASRMIENAENDEDYMSDAYPEVRIDL